MTLVHDVRTHTRRGGFAVRSRKAKSLEGSGKRTQHLRALLYLEAIFAEVDQLFVVVGDGWSVYHEARLGVFASLRYLVNIFFVVQEHALLLQLLCQLGRCLIVPSHHVTLLDEVTGNGTHANAARPYEIYCFNVLCLHNDVVSLSNVPLLVRSFNVFWPHAPELGLSPRRQWFRPSF